MTEAKVSQHKRDEVARIAGLIQGSRVVGVLNMEGLPARQLARLRSKMREDVTIIMSRKSLLKRAIEDSKSSKKGIEQLSESVTGMPALLFTGKSPFRVAQLILASKSKAPARPGQIAPYDLVVPAGPTSFTPGPIITELSSAGLKTGVENGKIVIKSDAVVARKGEEITRKVADLLVKFGIEPMEIGLDLVAAYEDGIVYGKDVLSVEQSEYLSRLQSAASDAFALSLEIGYATKENISRLIGAAFMTAKNIALNHSILSDVLIEKQMGVAELAAEAVAKSAGYSADSDADEKKSGENTAAVQKDRKAEGKKEEKPSAAEMKEAKPAAGKAEEQQKQEKGQKKPDVNPADVISRQFKDEIAAEKERRDRVSHEQAAELANQLKRKGTLRKE